jgi:hypothetical protein
MKPRWIPLLLMTTVGGTGWGQSQPQPRFVLSATQVARALSERGVQTEDKQVSLLAGVVATDPDPTLEVLSIETLSNAQPPGHAQIRSRVKLTCRKTAECLPFYAIVTWPQGTAWASTITSSSSPILKSPMGSSTSRDIPLASDVTMPAGTHAMLVLDDRRSHIQVSVVSLENGIAGHKIRVATPDHKQFYVGEVISANLLKGSF